MLQLANVNAGPACLIAYLGERAKGGAAREEGIAPLIVAAQTAANICRHAGARAATACDALPVAVRAILAAGAALARWWRMMDELALQAAGIGRAVAARINEMLAAGKIDAFENFVAAGLKLPRPAARRGASLSLRCRMISPAA